MADSTSASVLWRAIMDSEMELADEGSARKWKVASSSKVECGYCDDKGGVLIGCESEKCSKFYHLDCALQVEGLQFDSEEAIFTFECEKHHQPPYFCTCRKKYDASRDMVYCDQCSDWFHHSCEKINSATLKDDDEYTCLSCRKIIESGKEVPESLREANLDKEAHSNRIIKADKVMELIARLATDVCPVIDVLSGQIPESERGPINIKEIEDVIKTLSMSPYTPGSGAEYTEEEDCIRRLGIMDITSQWLGMAEDFVSRWNRWKGSVVSECKQLSNLFSTNLTPEKLPEIMSCQERFSRIEGERKQEFENVSDSMETYQLFTSALHWTLEFAQAFFESTKDDHWPHQMAQRVRSVQSVLKKLNNLKRDDLHSALHSWLRPFAALAEESVATISSWFNRARRILFEDGIEWEPLEIETLILETEGFATQPPLLTNIKGLLDTTSQILEKFNIFLNSTDYEEEVYNQLMNEKEDIGLLLPYEGQLNRINRHAIFLKALEMSQKEGRWSIDVAKSLVVEGQEIQQEVSTMTETLFPIIVALQAKLTSAINSLKENLRQAESLITSLKANNFESIDLSHLERFRTLPIITEQEEYLTICQDVDACHAEVLAISSASNPIKLGDLETLTEQMETILANNVLDHQQTIRDRKTLLRADLHQISNMLSGAEREWAQLASAIEDARKGLAANDDVVQSILTRCRATKITNDAVESEAVSMLEEGRQISEHCTQSLKVLCAANEDTVNSVKALVDKVEHNFVHALISKQVKLRFETLKTVINCRTILNSSAEGPVSKELSLLRELRQSILRLADLVESGSFEEDLLMGVKTEFLLFQWREEAIDILRSDMKTSVHHAQRLLSEYSLVEGGVLSSSDEYNQLKQATEECILAKQRAEEYLSAFETVVREFSVSEAESFLTTVGSGESKTSMDVDDANEQEQQVSPLMNLIPVMVKIYQRWISTASDLFKKVQALASDINQQHVVDDDASSLSQKLSQYFELMYHGLNVFQQMELSLQLDIDHVDSALLDHKYLQDRLTNLQSLPQEFLQTPFLSTILNALEIVNKDVHRYVEQYRNLVPPFVTRHRSRLDIKLASKEDLMVALTDPVAKTIRTPLHPQFTKVWSQLQALRVKLKDFLIHSHLKSPVQKVGESDMDEDEESLKNDMNALGSLRDEFDLIPLDLPETTAVQWASEVLSWVYRIPRPDLAEFEIDYEDAMECKKIAGTLVQAIPVATISALVDIGVMTADEDGAPTGFVANAHPHVKNIGDYFDFLEQQLALADAFAMKAERILGEPNLEMKTIEALVAERDNLTVLPPRQCVIDLDRVLDLEIRKKSAAVSAYIATGKVKQPKPEPQISTSAPALRPEKRSSRKCASVGCGNSLRLPITSSFCSDVCAVKSIRELTKAIITYKTNIQAHKQAAAVGAQLGGLHIGQFKSEDVKAFDIGTGGLRKAADHNSSSEESKSPRNAVGGPNVPVGNAIADVLNRLPKVAQGVLRLDKATDTLKATLPASKQAAYRATVRGTIEDILLAALSKNNVKGFAFHAALLAMEIEAGLFDKYDQSVSGDYQKHFRMLNTNLKRSNNEKLIIRLAKGDVAIKELLSMTVKQFADEDIQQERELQKEALAKNSIIENTDQQLEHRRRQAMAGTESWRDGSSGVGSSMSASESFSSQLDPLMATPDTGGDTAMDVDNMMMDSSSNDFLTPAPFLRSSSGDENSNDGRALEIERQILNGSAPSSAPTPTAKRSLDPDAGTRFTTDRDKRPRLDTSHQGESSSFTPSPHSPKAVNSAISSGPSLLQLLKSSAGPNASANSLPASRSTSADQDDDEEDEGSKMSREVEALLQKDKERQRQAAMAAKSSVGSGGKSLLSTIPSMRLINKDGGEQVTITRPGGIVISVTGMVSDKRMQGMLKASINVDFRTRIAEVERFISEVLAQGKKTVAIVLFVVPSAHAAASSSSYRKFCEEFTTAQRVGMSNVSDVLQLYLVPPALQSSISILRDVRLDAFPRQSIAPTEFQHQILFGIVVSKENGPSQFVTRHYPPLPLEPSSFSASTSSSSAAVVPSVPLNSGPGAVPFARPTAFDTTPSVAASAIPYTPPVAEQMRQIAELCAKQGPAALEQLRADQQNRFKLSFIYDGNPGYVEFQNLIIECAARANADAAARATLALQQGLPLTAPAVPFHQAPTGPGLLPATLGPRPQFGGPPTAFGGIPNAFGPGGMPLMMQQGARPFLQPGMGLSSQQPQPGHPTNIPQHLNFNQNLPTPQQPPPRRSRFN